MALAARTCPGGGHPRKRAERRNGWRTRASVRVSELGGPRREEAGPEPPETVVKGVLERIQRHTGFWERHFTASVVGERSRRLELGKRLRRAASVASAAAEPATGSEGQKFQRLRLMGRTLGRTTPRGASKARRLRPMRRASFERTLRNGRERCSGFGRRGANRRRAGPCKGSEGEPASAGEVERPARDPAREGRVAASQLRLGSCCFERAGRAAPWKGAA